MTIYERSWWCATQKKRMALVFITITMILQFQMKGCVGCLETERMGLLQLKSYLNNVLDAEEESILKSWSHDDRSSDCCHWERVKCSDTIGGHMVNLTLDAVMRDTDTFRYSDVPLNLSLFHSFPQLKTHGTSVSLLKEANIVFFSLSPSFLDSLLRL